MRLIPGCPGGSKLVPRGSLARTSRPDPAIFQSWCARPGDGYARWILRGAVPDDSIRGVPIFDGSGAAPLYRIRFLSTDSVAGAAGAAADVGTVRCPGERQPFRFAE